MQVSVLDAIDHPDYANVRPTGVYLINDLSLLKVAPMDFDALHIRPACIKEDQTEFEGKKCYVAGWGSTSNKVEGLYMLLTIKVQNRVPRAQLERRLFCEKNWTNCMNTAYILLKTQGSIDPLYS